MHNAFWATFWCKFHGGYHVEDNQDTYLSSFIHSYVLFYFDFSRGGTFFCDQYFSGTFSMDILASFNLKKH